MRLRLRPAGSFLLFSAMATGLMRIAAANDGAAREWRSYGGDPGGTRYSTLADIQAGNVARLRRAWTYHTGDLETDLRPQARPTAFETTPLAVAGRLYLTTPSGRVVSLDGDTGRELWRFDPAPRAGQTRAPRGVHRGVSYWE